MYERTDVDQTDAAIGDEPTGERQTLVIIGNGMTSFKLCQRLVECGAHQRLDIVVFGEEPRPAYDRVHLTELFSGKTAENLTFGTEDWYEENGIRLYLNDPVIEIDRDDCSVLSEQGQRIPYHRLVFATGSRPFVPPIQGVDLPGVFVYRTVEDVYAILKYRHDFSVPRAAVIGGGLLGLEAAKAVYDCGAEVHVIEFAPVLMPRQLDPKAASLLKDKIEQLGVRVMVGTQTTRIEEVPPVRHVTGRSERLLHFSDGRKLAVDMVVISTGIRPRGDLAASCGITVAKNGGIIVDDHLTTSDPFIFAIGECAVHRDTTYGLAYPGYKMVDVLVDNLVGGTAKFEGADQSAKLKLMGVTVASLGEYGEKDAAAPAVTVNIFDANGIYRKLVMREGRIIGAMSVGDWDNLDRVRDAIEQPRAVNVNFWDMRRFRSTGSLWKKSESPPIAEWPADALVCGCLRVNRGTLSQAQMDGCFTVDELCARTGAGTMCGSCKPLLAELLGGGRDSVPPSMRADALPLSMRSPMSVRTPPVSRRSVATPAPTTPPPPAIPRPAAVPRLDTMRPRAGSSVAPPGSDPRALVSHTPTPVVPAMPAKESAAEAHGVESEEQGPLSRRGSMLPPAQGRRSSIRPPQPQAFAAPSTRPQVEVVAASRRTREIDDDVGPLSAPLSIKAPERVSIAALDEDDDEPAPVSVRFNRTAAASMSGGGSRSQIPYRHASVAPLMAQANGNASRSRSVLPPPASAGDTIRPPASGEAPPSMRDALPASVRDRFSLKHRDATSRLMREADFYSRDGDGDGARESVRGLELLRGGGALHGRDNATSESGPRSRRAIEADADRYEGSPSSRHDSIPPPSRRRDSLPPLKPISIPPVRGSIPPGRVSVPPGQISMAPPRSQPAPQEERGGKPLLVASVASLAFAGVAATVGPLPIRTSTLGAHPDAIWTTSAGKQVTGYAVLILGLVSLLLSLRKRWKRFSYSDVPALRVLHGALGAGALLALILHTGLHLGKNLNRTLMIDYLALVLLGAGAGLFVSQSHRFPPLTARNYRLVSFRAHLILFWPLPVLLALHVLGSYYY